MTEQYENQYSPEDSPSQNGSPRQRPSRRGGLRLFLRLFSAIVVITLTICVYVGYEAWTFMNTPAETSGRDIVVNIEPGTSFGAMAASLQEQGLITDARKFKLLARLQKKEQNMQAGRFLMRTSWLPQTVLDQMVSGQALLHRVTIPEGRPWWEIASILESNGICTAKDFITVIHDADFLSHWGIPFANAEGFLYPDTYLLLQPQEMDIKAARSIANRLVETFWKRTADLWQGQRPGPETLRRIIILASIVEKETGVGGERARVAGVYTNRLQKNMLLQADPTVIYGMGPGFSGQLLRRHLENEENPYNTYRRAGLTPGPICSPGAAAIKAALNPEKHDFLYFVATGRDKGHVFSKNLKDHNRAVQAYRKALREQGLR